MNKYGNLAQLLADIIFQPTGLSDKEINKILDVVQELVDKATPKKPPKHDRVVCPTCNSKANYGHPNTEYCCHCGQALNWELSELVINSKELDGRIYIEGEGVYKVQDLVHSPNHYIGEYGLEVEEVLRNFLPRYEDSYVAHRIGSAIEYLIRAPEKNGLEDLKKARKNLDLAIERLENER